MPRSAPAIAAVAVVVAGGAAWAATHQSSDQPPATALPTVAPAVTATPSGASSATGSASPAPSGATRTIQGPSEDMRWGPVQVTLIVQGSRITDVQATAPTERERSAFINNQAVPMLRQETLQAQNANIDLISGATMTSEAFAASLQAALQQAHL